MPSTSRSQISLKKCRPYSSICCAYNSESRLFRSISGVFLKIASRLKQNRGYAPSSQIVPRETCDPSASGCSYDVECINVEAGNAKGLGRIPSNGQLTPGPKP